MNLTLPYCRQFDFGSYKIKWKRHAISRRKYFPLDLNFSVPALFESFLMHSVLTLYLLDSEHVIYKISLKGNYQTKAVY